MEGSAVQQSSPAVLDTNPPFRENHSKHLRISTSVQPSSSQSSLSCLLGSAYAHDYGVDYAEAGVVDSGGLATGIGEDYFVDPALRHDLDILETFVSMSDWKSDAGDDPVEEDVVELRGNAVVVASRNDPAIASDCCAIENDFCRDFVCCGHRLPDLHALLQHYEDKHVHIQSNPESSFPGQTHYADGHTREDDVSEDEFWEFGVAAFEDSVIVPGNGSYESCASQKRMGDVEDDLNERVLQVIQEESEREAKRIKLLSDVASVPSHSAVGDTLLECEKAEREDGGLDREEDDGSSVSGQRRFARDDNEERPYRCQHPGCDKAYKNPNGLKYHAQHGHTGRSDHEVDMALRFMKPYVCDFQGCMKRYKNLNGLKYHIEKSHGLNRFDSNQLATSIVKKTNADFGIQARSVPNSVLFAAMKQRDEMERVDSKSAYAFEALPLATTLPAAVGGTQKPPIPLAPRVESGPAVNSAAYSAALRSYLLMNMASGSRLHASERPMASNATVQPTSTAIPNGDQSLTVSLSGPQAPLLLQTLAANGGFIDIHRLAALAPLKNVPDRGLLDKTK